MKIVKFRAKIIRAGKWSKWIYGSLDFTKYTYQEARIVGYDDPVQYWHKIDKNTIGQYTGQKDKNKKEIYEGDILRFSEVDTAVVEWNEKYSYFMVKPIQDYYFDSDVLGHTLEYNNNVEIIGNIYDNPELLKEGI